MTEFEAICKAFCEATEVYIEWQYTSPMYKESVRTGMRAALTQMKKTDVHINRVVSNLELESAYIDMKRIEGHVVFEKTIDAILEQTDEVR